jgi:hypothetical protein
MPRDAPVTIATCPASVTRALRPARRVFETRARDAELHALQDLREHLARPTSIARAQPSDCRGASSRPAHRRRHLRRQEIANASRVRVECGVDVGDDGNARRRHLDRGERGRELGRHRRHERAMERRAHGERNDAATRRLRRIPGTRHAAQ